MVQSLWQVININPEKPNMRLIQIISVVVLWLLVPLSYILGQDQCPDGYGFALKNSCYKFVIKTENRNNAASKCTAEEAHLADIKSEEEQLFIVNWLQGIDAGDTWIGLSGQETDDYVWTDGSPLDYSAWAPNQPTEEQCVRLQKDNNYQWNDINCFQGYPYICEIEALGCPAGWHFHNDLCYFVEGQQLLEYDQARDACIEMNATLSSVNNQEEQYVHNRFATLYDRLWIGLNDKVDEDVWQWEDKSTFNFTNWANGQPDNAGNEDCTHLWNGGEWNDIKCVRKYGYICKKAIPKPTTTAPTTAAITTPVLTSHLEEPVSPDVTNTTGTSDTPKPQSSALSSGAIAGAVIGSIFLLVLLVLILFLIVSRPWHETQTKSGTATVLAFDGPYDLTIEGKSNYKPQDTEHPIYTDEDDDKKQQPIYADLTSTKLATNVYQSIGESSTDNNTAPVYIDSVPNNDAPNSGIVPATGDKGSGQDTSLYYARSDSHQDTNAAPNTAEQENCQEGSLYYAKSDSHPATNGGIPQESSAANTGAGWEDNAAYSSFEDGELVHDQDNLGGQQEQEGWEDNGLYSGNGIQGNDDDEEEWKDNSIYAGSDPE